MTIVDIINSAAHIFKIYRGSNMKSVITFKQGLIGWGNFIRERWRTGKCPIGYGFAFLGIQVIQK